MRIQIGFAAGLYATLLMQIGCGQTTSMPATEPVIVSKGEYPAFASIRDLAGSATSDDEFSSLAFNVPIPTLTEAEEERHIAGDFLFSRKFNAESGIGPAFNANACVACHQLDGRGSLPLMPANGSSVRLGFNESLLLRISLETEAGSQIVPGFSEQLFQKGISQLRPDSPGTGQADVDMNFVYSKFVYPDGKVLALKKPVFKLSNAYDSVGGKKSALDDPRLSISPRVGPPMIGLGLLEAIDDQDILALADPDDNDGDGISGRPNLIDGKIGKLGWKANNINIRQQVAAAFSNDMGIRSSVFPLENISGTDLFKSLIDRLGALWNPLETELKDESLDALEFYTATLAVPRRRDVASQANMNGARTFEKIGCTSCHTPHFKTGESKISPSLSHIDIYPFSDGLLHDMGDDLADGRSDHQANGREWKTRPLWGIGMTQTANPRAGFLHDGRADSVEAAIIHHGGEAKGARERFTQLTRPERQEVLSFLRSL